MTIRAPRSIDDYVRMLDQGEHFTQMNYGDGEWGNITDTLKGPNCDGKPATEMTRTMLAKTVLEPRFTFFGYNPGKPDHRTRIATEAWLGENGVNVPELGPHALEDPHHGTQQINVRWTHKEILPSANLRGRFGPLIRALRNRPLVVIGPDHLTHDFVDRVLGARKRGLLPLSWSLDERLVDVVTWARNALDGMPGDTVISWSLGYIAKVAAWYVAESHPHVTQIDLGACWSPYCGQLIRSGYAKPEFQEMMRKNLEEAA